MTVSGAAFTPAAGERARERSDVMLRWSLGFLLLALVAALFGFGGIATAAAGIAEILFFIFIALFVLALVVGLLARA
jgi:uncharacterized membrane protein YtjA (UPF0391 family)